MTSRTASERRPWRPMRDISWKARDAGETMLHDRATAAGSRAEGRAWGMRGWRRQQR